MFHQVEGLLVDEHTPPSPTSRARWPNSCARSSSAISRCASAPAISPSPSPRRGSRHRLAATRRHDALAGRCWAAAWSIRNVLRNVGIDPEKYTGFAFGLGVERFAMLTASRPARVSSRTTCAFEAVRLRNGIRDCLIGDSPAGDEPDRRTLGPVLITNHVPNEILENWLRSHVRPPAPRGTRRDADRDRFGSRRRQTAANRWTAWSSRASSNARHPEADRRVCEVDADAGAACCRSSAVRRTRAGLVAPLATDGTKIGDMTIKAAKLRGVESSGMLCSAKKPGPRRRYVRPAGTAGRRAGRRAAGRPPRSADASIELKLTRTAPDCFGVRGIAFDVAAACGRG